MLSPWMSVVSPGEVMAEGMRVSMVLFECRDYDVMRMKVSG